MRDLYTPSSRQIVLILKRYLFGIVLFVGLAEPVLAQSVALKRNQTVRNQNLSKNWTVPFSFETESSTHQEWSYERTSSSTISLSPSYFWGPSLRISGNLGLTKEHSGVGDTNFNNSSLGINYLIPASSQLSWMMGTSAIIPTNPQEREEKSYQGAVRLSGGFSFSEIWKGSRLSYRLILGRNFHGYSQGADGSYNLRQSLTHSLDYLQPMGSKFSVSTVFQYTQASTYLDDLRFSFLAMADLAFDFSESLAISVGTANQGSALRPNGRDSNVEFFNDESSIVKIGITYVL